MRHTKTYSRGWRLCRAGEWCAGDAHKPQSAIAITCHSAATWACAIPPELVWNEESTTNTRPRLRELALGSRRARRRTRARLTDSSCQLSRQRLCYTDARSQNVPRPWVTPIAVTCVAPGCLSQACPAGMLHTCVENIRIAHFSLAFTHYTSVLRLYRL